MFKRNHLNEGVKKEKRRSARIIRFPLFRRAEPLIAAECQHRWIFVAPGYQLCTKCGAVRKKPSEGAAP